MYFKNTFLIISIQIVLCKLKYQDIFHDDFDALETSKWDILDRKADCEKLDSRKMTCDTSNEINLRTISGTLAITAISQAYFDRKFTSATLVSHNAYRVNEFNYLIRIRAALTKEPGLFPHVYLILDQDYNRRVFISFFTIISRSYTKVWNGSSLDQVQDTLIMNKTNLDQFQNYDMIINTKDSRFIWRVNDQIYFNSTSNRGFWDKLMDFPFRIGITLDLDSDYTEKQLDDLSFMKWKCPTFFIDYVQIFRSKQSHFDLSDSEISQDKKNIPKICENIISLEDQAKITPGLIEPLDLLWSDEFNEESLKQSNWIIKNPHIKCTDQNKTEDKNCNSYDNPNIKLSNGTLKLFLIGEESIELDEPSSLHSTGLVIASIQFFKYVRVEIRAKRPKGVDLTAKLYMQAYQDGESDTANVKGALDIAHLNDPDEHSWQMKAHEMEVNFRKHKTTSDLYYDNNFIVSSINLTSNLQHVNYYHASENLDQFQNYAIEWNEIGIQWVFNDRVIYQANPKMDQYGRFMTLDNYNGDGFFLPFKRPFRLLIKVLASYNEEGSDPPIFEIDYVRVYGNQLIGSEIIDLRDSQKLNDQNVTDQNSNKKELPYLLIGISSAVIILIILLVIALVFALLKIKNINQAKETDEQNKKEHHRNDSYDDIIISLENIYEPYDYTNDYEHIDDIYDDVNLGARSNPRQTEYDDVLIDESKNQSSYEYMKANKS